MSRFHWFYNHIVKPEFFVQHKVKNLIAGPNLKIDLFFNLKQFNFNPAKLPMIMFFFKNLTIQNGSLIYSKKNIADLNLRSGFIAGFHVNMNLTQFQQFLEQLLVVLADNPPVVIKQSDQRKSDIYYLRLVNFNFKLFPLIDYTLLDKPIYLGFSVQKTSNNELISMLRLLGIPVIYKLVLVD